LEQTFAGVATTAITQVSFYMSGGSGTAVDFYYQGGADDEFLVNGTPTAVTGWDFFDATSNLNTSGTLIGFEVFGNSSLDSSSLDDLSITSTSTSSLGQ
jgi:hypothetical protein